MTKSIPDRPARARTRAGRLAAWDAWLVRQVAGARAPLRVADVGFGESPATVVELQAALAEAGLERRRARARARRRAGGDGEAGGSGAPLRAGWLRRARCASVPSTSIRVANVLRSYRAEEVPAVHAALAAALAPGGLALEGSSDTEGHVSTWYVLRPGPVRERLVFHTDFARGFSPKLFRDWLPSDYRRNLAPESELARLLDGVAGGVGRGEGVGGALRRAQCERRTPAGLSANGGIGARRRSSSPPPSASRRRARHLPRRRPRRLPRVAPARRRARSHPR